MVLGQQQNTEKLQKCQSVKLGSHFSTPRSYKLASAHRGIFLPPTLSLPTPPSLPTPSPSLSAPIISYQVQPGK